MDKKAIEIKNLHYSYPDGAEALRNISLDIFEKESVGIIGPNGAGKSTLLFHLNGILRGSGPIRIFDLEINERNLPVIRRSVGLVFQEPDNQLFMPTVFDDVAFGPLNMQLAGEKVQLAVEEALGEVDMLGSIQRSPHHLSFGEKKRISIAAVLSMKPQILALDEPASNLDPGHRRKLIAFLQELPLTKIIVTHDLDLVGQTCSRIILMDKGRLITAGLTADILQEKTLLEKHSLL